MSIIVERFNKIKSNINKLKPTKPVNIVAISKTFSLEHIKPLIDFGHDHFGENKVQEAKAKWSDLKNKNSENHCKTFILSLPRAWDYSGSMANIRKSAHAKYGGLSSDIRRVMAKIHFGIYGENFK